MSVKTGNIAVSVVAVLKDAGNVRGSGGSFRLLLPFLFGLLPLFFGVLLLTLFFVLLALISHDLPLSLYMNNNHTATNPVPVIFG